MAVAALIWIYDVRKFLHRCLETKGIVIDSELVNHGSDQPHWLYHTVFQFTDQRSGQEIKVRSDKGNSHPTHSIGQEVVILYDPERITTGRKPDNAKIKSFSEIWGGFIVSLIILSAILLSIGLILAFLVL